MSVERSKSKDYDALHGLSKPGAKASAPLRPPLDPRNTNGEPKGLVNFSNLTPGEPEAFASHTDQQADDEAHTQDLETPPPAFTSETAPFSSPSSEAKADKKLKKEEKDRKLLGRDRWLVRNGHSATYVGLYLFSILVLFRPYEIVPGLGFLSATAFYFAVATLAIFVPSQLATEGNLTTFPTEVKAILAMTLIAIFTIPIAKDPGLAWEKFNDPYIKAVVIFIVLVNVVRTRKRLMGMMWLSFGIGIYLSFAALDMYLKGQFNVEDYRVAVNVGGMFGNPNEMAMHLVMMTPIVITLGIAARKSLWRWIYFAAAFLFIAANMVTFSRGGFLSLIGCAVVLAWKIGRKYRLNVTIASIVIGGIAIIAAPGNYGLRMLSIFIPGLDAVGSSDQRRELLERSLLVTARNPWGIGIGNFPMVGVRNLESHNAFTQVSSELGILGLIAYLIFMISPFRKLSAIERTQFDADDLNWYYYLAIGLQASIVGYMVSSFFASVAYGWFIYYLIAYAVAFRRIYSLEMGLKEDVKPQPLWQRQGATA